MTVGELGKIVDDMRAAGDGGAHVLMDQPIFPGLMTIQRHAVMHDVRFQAEDGTPTGEPVTALILSIREAE